MLPRTLEPEVMDTPEEARDYDAMDHSAVNRVFVDDLLTELNPSVDRSIEMLDAGTGTALIPIELAGRADYSGRIIGVDLARHMLDLADENVRRAGLSERIGLELVDSKLLPYADGRFGAVMSNSIVHHIPEPISVLSEMHRVLAPGGLLFVRDLMRPAEATTVEHLVETYAGDENADQRQLFRQSLHAALTVEEVRSLLDELDLDPAAGRATSDRHWTIALTKPK